MLACLAVWSVCLTWTWPPAANGGDNQVGDLPTGGSFDANALNQALDVLREAGHASVADGILSGLANHSVNVTNLHPAPNGTGGASDANTIAIDPKLGKDPEVLAGLLAHEWHHVKQFNGSPDTGDEGSMFEPCFESYAYAEQIRFMCDLMDARRLEEPSGVHPYYCAWVDQVYAAQLWYSAVCTLSGGSAASFSPCLAPYCEE